jgi:hypothetical protein
MSNRNSRPKLFAAALLLAGMSGPAWAETSRAEYLKTLTPDNSAFLFIDNQTKLMMAVQSIDHTVLMRNPKLSLEPRVYAFWGSSAAENIYAPGARLRDDGGDERCPGWEPELEAAYAFHRNASVALSIARFEPSAFFDDAPPNSEVGWAELSIDYVF